MKMIPKLQSGQFIKKYIDVENLKALNGLNLVLKEFVFSGLLAFQDYIFLVSLNGTDLMASSKFKETKKESENARSALKSLKFVLKFQYCTLNF